MKKLICSVFAFTCVWFVSLVYAQNKTANTANTAILIPNAEVQAKLKEMIEKKLQDDSVRVVNAGESNLGVFFVHLNPGDAPKEPVQLMSHNDVTEVYYVLKGEGTLYHGGTIENPTRAIWSQPVARQRLVPARMNWRKMSDLATSLSFQPTHHIR